MRLPVSKVPVFVRYGSGVSLGYRRNAGPGVWIARIADGTGGKIEKRLAIADDAEAANGKDVMTFAQASAAAQSLARTGSPEPKAEKIATIGDAVAAYAAGPVRQDNVTRLKFNLPSALARRPISLLTSGELMAWRDALAKKQSPASVNRVCTILKAALNRAADGDAAIVSRRAWEVGLAALPDSQMARNIVIDEAAIRTVVAEARKISPEFGLLVEVLAQTGARVSQVARVECRDLVGQGDDARLMIPSSAKGMRKRASRTPVPVPAALADKLRVAAAGRPADAPLLVKVSGEPWKQSDHSRLFDRARVASALPEDVTCYALRHSHITAQLLAGLPVQLVSRLHDTSASQIEKNYASEIASHGDSLVRQAFVVVDQPSAEVISLRK